MTTTTSSPSSPASELTPDTLKRAKGIMDALYEKGDLGNGRAMKRDHFYIEPQHRYIKLQEALEWLGDPNTEVDSSRFWYAPYAYVGIAKIGSGLILHQTVNQQMVYQNNDAGLLEALAILTSVLYP